jgi:hypothetical protein
MTRALLRAFIWYAVVARPTSGGLEGTVAQCSCSFIHKPVAHKSREVAMVRFDSRPAVLRVWVQIPTILRRPGVASASEYTRPLTHVEH